MTRFITIILLTFICGFVYSQDGKKNAFILEAGGNGYYYSINYERGFLKSGLVRVGVGTANGNWTIPVLAGKYFGNGNHHFELTGGLTLLSETIDVTGFPEDEVDAVHLHATAFIGYRLQNPEKKFLFRIGYTPLFRIYSTYSDTKDTEFYHWGGLSFGYRF